MSFDEVSEHDTPNVEEKECDDAREKFHPELSQLCGQVETGETNQDYLKTHDYFGLPAGTTKQQQKILAAFEIAAKTLPEGTIRSLPPQAIKNLILEHQGDLEEANSEDTFSALFEKLKQKEISNRDYLNQVLALAETDQTAVPPEFVA